MMNKKITGWTIPLTILLTALITGTAVYILTAMGPGNGSTAGTDRSTDQTSKSGIKKPRIIYWKAPMDPTEIYEAPGKSKMGMDLVPVYEDEMAEDDLNGERKIVYWKAPMDPTEIYETPGKSKMGMDLVPVYEDELVGGVDIKINPVVEQNMGLKIKAVEKGPLNHTIRTYGHLTPDETRIGIISPKTAGWIEKLYADYTGFRVEKGQPLYEIYSPSLLSSQEEYLSVYRNYQQSKTPLNRELLTSARKRLEYYDIADPEITAIETGGSVKKTLLVRSSFQGVVTRKNVTEGEFVKSGADLFTITDLTTIWVEAHIFEYEQNLVQEGQAVEMTLSYYPGKVYRGTIAYIFPYLQAKTRDVVIRISFDNEKGELKPDMFARIKIKTGAGKTGLFIPSQAVVHSGERELVFVAKGKGRFTPRQITTGLYLEEGRVQVLTGLTPGENIVVSGQFLLDSESKLKEAIQKMVESKSGPARGGKRTVTEDSDGFFDELDEMESGDDFFKDME